MKEITLTNGQVAIVDDDDYDRLSEYTWYVQTKDGYAQRHIRVGKKNTFMLMHHDVIGKPPAGMVSDHINRNRLDNRKSNLRHCTQSQNRLNSSIRSDNTSGIHGVHKLGNRWRARIRVGGRSLFAREFTSLEEAAKAYNEAAPKIFESLFSD